MKRFLKTENFSKAIVFRIITFLFLCFFMVACNFNKTDRLNLGEKLRYNNNGVSFSYYKGWKVSEDESQGVRHITIKDSREGHILLHFWKGDFSMGISLYAKNIIGNYDKTLSMNKIPEMAVLTKRRISGQDINGERYEFTNRESLTSSIPFIAEFYEVRGKTKNVVVHLENSSDDWELSQSDFQLVLESLEFE